MYEVFKPAPVFNPKMHMKQPSHYQVQEAKSLAKIAFWTTASLVVFFTAAYFNV